MLLLKRRRNVVRAANYNTVSVEYSILIIYVDGIMHKWANRHFDDFEKKSPCNMKYRKKRGNTK